MNEQTMPRIPLFHVFASIICALFLGFVLWRMTLRSDAKETATDQIFLVFYLLLTVTCYLGSLRLANRYCNFSSREAIPGLVFVSLVGTSLPFIVNSIHIWFRTYLELGWFVGASAKALGLLNVVMLFMITLLAGLGFLVTKFFQATAKLKKKAELTLI